VYDFHYSYFLSVDPTASGYVEIHTFVDNVQIKEIQYRFQTDGNGELLIAIFYGETKILPKVDYIKGEGGIFTIKCDLKYRKGEKLKLYYNNTNTTTKRTCTLLFLGNKVEG